MRISEDRLRELVNAFDTDWTAYGREALKRVGAHYHRQFINWVSYSSARIDMYERDYMEAIRHFYKDVGR